MTRKLLGICMLQSHSLGKQLKRVLPCLALVPYLCSLPIHFTNRQLLKVTFRLAGFVHDPCSSFAGCSLVDPLCANWLASLPSVEAQQGPAQATEASLQDPGRMPTQRPEALRLSHPAFGNTAIQPAMFELSDQHCLRACHAPG